MGSDSDPLSTGGLNRYSGRVRRYLLLVTIIALAAPLSAKDSLGVFEFVDTPPSGLPRFYRSTQP